MFASFQVRDAGKFMLARCGERAGPGGRERWGEGGMKADQGSGKLGKDGLAKGGSQDCPG